jgi:hypothetical protein
LTESRNGFSITYIAVVIGSERRFQGRGKPVERDL